MKNAFEELKAFHIFSVQNDVEYSIRSRKCIGLFNNKNVFTGMMILI